jgi:glycosyltransferase involved in cell wall biosynthesis
VIGSVGNLRPVKDHALLIQACADLVAEGIDLEVRVAGEGPERTNLSQLARSLNISDRVALPGFRSDVPGFLRDLDIFVLTSRSEQHPNVLTEAMACQLPCVATRVGGVEELLDSGRCGRIIETGDRRGLAQALHGLALSPEARRQLALNARQRACDRYGESRMIASYQALYRGLSQHRRGA